MDNQPPKDQPENQPPHNNDLSNDNVAPQEQEPSTLPVNDGSAPVETQAAPIPDFATQADAIDAMPSPYVQTAKPAKRSKRGLLIGIAAGLLLLGGGGVAAYNYWYQNPQKVITDAVINMFKAESFTLDGTFAMEGDFGDDVPFSKMIVAVDSKSTKTEGLMNAKLTLESEDKTNEFSGSAVVDDEYNVYFKVNDVQEIVDELLEDYGDGTELPPAATRFIEKIDGQWIRLGREDLDEYDDELAKEQECFSDVYKKYENDNSAQQQIAEAYRNNQFIVIEEKLGSKDGNLGYLIDGDGAKFKDFVKAIEQIDLFKDLVKCDDSFEFDADDIDFSSDDDSDVEGRLELWISRFGHELRQTKITASDDEFAIEMIINTRFNEVIEVETPEKFITVKELIEDIEDMYAEIVQDAYEQAMLEYEDEFDYELDYDFDEELDSIGGFEAT